MCKITFNLILTLLFSLITTATQAADEVIVQMTTKKALGETFTFSAYAANQGTTLQVDFGDGNLVTTQEIATSSPYTSISGELKGATIKVYGGTADLAYLNISSLSLSSLDVSKNTELTSLNCNSNLLTNLDVNNNTKLTSLSCHSNSFSNLDLSKNTELSTLNCSKNSISSLDLNNNTELKWLFCYNNPLSNLDVSNNTNLTTLKCHSNTLSNLDLSKNTKLASLDCYSNTLSSLDVSNNTELTSLDCNNNLLSNLDVSNNTELTNLNCSKNSFTFSTLPLTIREYNYLSQDSISIQDKINVFRQLDLSSESEVDGVSTIYKWKTISGSTLIEGDDYTISNGITVFLKAQTQKVYCKMTNIRFPDLILTTKTTTIGLPQEIINMTTEKTVGETFAFSVYATTPGTTLQVDFGDGNLVTTEEITTPPFTTISGKLKGATIKVYGETADLNYLEVNSLSLSSLDVSNNTELIWLHCAKNSISSLDVSNNTELTTLDCNSNLLTNLDVKNNTKLTKLSFYSNTLSNLDISNNTEIIWLNCYNNHLSILDVRNNTKLTSLNCNNNRLTNLDVSNNTKLSTLICAKNSISSLDLSNNTELIWIECNNNLLSNLDVHNSTTLTTLSCAKNSISSLDLSNNTELKLLNCNNNHLTNLDVSSNTKLTNLNCEENSLTFSTLPLKEPTLTTFLYSPQGSISIAENIEANETIDLSNENEIDGTTTTYTWKTIPGTTLVEGTDYTINNGKTTFLKSQSEKVYCKMTNTKFPDLTLSTTKTTFTEPAQEIINMTTEKSVGESFSFFVSAASSGTTLQIDFGDGNLVTTEEIATSSPYTTISGELKGSTVKVYGTPSSLTSLTINSLSLTSLDVSKNTELTELTCSDNSLSTLDVSSNTALNLLYCSHNSLSNLDVSKNTELKSLKCSWNSLSSLNVNNNTKLMLLYCSNNSLTNLDASNNTYMERLDCSFNALVSLGVNNNTKLTELTCSRNSLTSLNVSSCTKLQKLSCSNNSIVSLDMSNNTQLMELFCYQNSLNNLDVNNNIKLKYLFCHYNSLTSLDVSNNIRMEELDCSDNSLTSLNTNNNTELTKIYCQNNALANLDVSKNTELTVLSCYSNAFTFSTLPLEEPRFTTFTYTPQAPISIAENIEANGSIDLSSENEIDGIKTTYTWKTKSGKALVEGTDYTISNGVTTFSIEKTQNIYCEMTNAKFPDLTLSTTLVKVLATTTGIEKKSLGNRQIYAVGKTIYVKANRRGLLSVYDLSGTIVLQQTVEEGTSQIPVSRNGIYVVHLKENGRESVEKVLIK